MPTTIGTLVLEPMGSAIGITLNYSGDGTTNNTAVVQFKKSADPTWRTAIEPDRLLVGAQKKWVAMATYLDQQTSYDVRVTITDPDGVVGTNPIQGTAVTLLETPPVRPGVFDRFVAIGGNDGNDGLTVGTAWATIERAMVAAPSGAKVRVGPGTFSRPSTIRATPIELYAEFPAVDDNRAIINAGNHTIIDGGFRIAAGVGAWTLVTLGGNSVWQATSGLAGISGERHQVAYGANAQAAPFRSASWKFGGPVTSPTSFALQVRQSNTYRQGNYVDADTDTIYLWEGAGFDPNAYYWSIGTGLSSDQQYGPIFTATARFSGFEVRTLGWGVGIAGGTGSVVDHNLFYSCINAIATSTADANVLAYNRIVDSGMWNLSQTGIPWDFIKSDFYDNTGAATGQRQGEANETSAGLFAGTRTMAHHNTIIGTMNGWTGDGSLVHSHHNLFQQLIDDAEEPESGANIRFWISQDNRIEQALDGISLAPVNEGPVYLINNVYWRLGAAGVGRAQNGNFSGGTSGVKVSRGCNPAPSLYMLFCTWWSDDAGAEGANENGGGGPPGSPPRMWMVGNIGRTMRYIHDFDTATWVIRKDDYNFWTSTAQTAGSGNGVPGYNLRGTDHDSTLTTGALSIAALRTALGDAANTNRLAAVDYALVGSQSVIDTNLTDPASGDVTLKSTSVFRNAGPATYPNIRDLVGINFEGSATDLGAIEYGLSAPTTPTAPSGLGAVAISSSQIDLTWTDNSANETGFALQRKTGVGGTYADVATVGPNITSYSNTGLTPSTTYYYRVRATGTGGDSGYSNESNASTPATGVPPAAPSALTATPNGSGRVDLAWVDNATNETAQVVLRRNLLSSAWYSLASLAPNVASYSDLTVAPGTIYGYQIRAENGAGTNLSNVATAMMPGGTASRTLPTRSNGQVIDAGHINTLHTLFINEARSIFNASEFGVLANGSANDTSAIQSALTAAAAAGGGLVLLPAGVMTVSTLTIGPRVTLAGQGAASVLRLRDATPGPVIKKQASPDANGQNGQFVVIRDLMIEGNAGGQSSGNAHGIDLTTNPTGTQAAGDLAFDSYDRVEGVIIARCKGNGVQVVGRSSTIITRCWAVENDGYGFLVGSDTLVSDCVAQASGLSGFALVQVAGAHLVGCRSLQSGRLGTTDGHGYLVSTGYGGTRLTACEARDNKRAGFQLTSARYVVVEGAVADSNSTTAIGNSAAYAVVDSDHCRLEGVAFDRFVLGQGGLGAPSQTQALRLTKTGGTPGANQIDLTHGGAQGATVSGGEVMTGSNAVAETGNRIYINGVQYTANT